MRNSKRTSKYPERTLFDLTHKMSVIRLVPINVETLRTVSEYFIGKELIELIFYESLNGIIPNCQSGLFMSYLYMWSKDISSIDSYIFTMTYKALARGSPRHHKLDTI